MSRSAASINHGYRSALPEGSEFLALQRKFPVGSTVKRDNDEGTVEKLLGCAAFVDFDFNGKDWYCLTELEAK